MDAGTGIFIGAPTAAALFILLERIWPRRNKSVPDVAAVQRIALYDLVREEIRRLEERNVDKELLHAFLDPLTAATTKLEVTCNLLKSEIATIAAKLSAALTKLADIETTLRQSMPGDPK